MNLFWSNRAKRNTSFMVLPLWLFALASGFANACLLEVPVAHSHAVIRESAEPALAPAESDHHAHATSGHHAGPEPDHHAGAEPEHHAGAVGDPGEDLDTSKAPCHKICDDGSHSLPTQRSSVDQENHGAVAIIAVLWAVPAPIVPTSYRIGDLLFPVPGPPFRVRYSRLTL